MTNTNKYKVLDVYYILLSKTEISECQKFVVKA